jgi:dipeptidase D
VPLGSRLSPVANRRGYDDDPYRGLEPPGLWRHFAALNKIPRPSGQEGAARDYVREVAESFGAEAFEDPYGNTVVRAAARPGAADRQLVAVQTHLDMVCVAAPGVAHDFDHDPIVPIRDGDKISADGTTLGADNGIGVAAALALLTEPDLACGPLELLFTVEEEVGLLGALHFDPALLKATSLINLDSENDKALTVGCAGGAEVVLRLEPERITLPPDWECAELRVSGLSGGHSGVQIHEHRANAIKLLVALFERLRNGGVDLGLASIAGGTAHNAIPTEATALFAFPSSAADQAAAIAVEATADLKQEWGADEPDLTVKLDFLDSRVPSLADQAGSLNLLNLLAELPHGMIAMSSRFEETVATSVNLALVKTDGETIEVLTSIRGLTEEELDATTTKVKGIGEKAGARIEVVGGYPGWEPREDSPLLTAATTAYERLHGESPLIEVVHGGLECGVLVANKPDLDAISFGPLIREAHTPQEHVYAGTVSGTWRLLLALLECADGR